LYLICNRPPVILLYNITAMGGAGCAMHKGPRRSEGPLAAKRFCIFLNPSGEKGPTPEALHKRPHKTPL